MKALVYTTQAKMDGRKVIEPGKCELLDIPEPQLLPTDDMKIRVDYCAMCATDVHIVTMGLYGMPAPWIMGHELCGTIVEVNPRATENGFAVGDKVVVNCTAPCGCCDECKRGHDIFCKHPIAGSFVHGFTEYCTAVCEQVFQIPKNSPIDPKYYCLAEPMASAMDGMDLADIKIGDNVLLQGCGAIGSIILNMLLLKGGANVTVSGVPAAAPLLPKLLANKGTVVYFAVFPMDYELPLNLYDLYIKEGRLQTVFTTIYNYPRVIDLIPRMNLDVIANREMKLSDGVEIFNAFLESKSNKIIVDCQH